MVRLRDKSRDKARDNQGLVLGSALCVFATFGFVITLMPRTDPQQWGAILVVGTLGPVGGVVLAWLAWTALRRATKKPARIVAQLAFGLSVAGAISALSLWTL